MTEKTNDCICRVDCNVCTCVFNDKGAYCAADHIKVANEKAERKAETFCATFSPKKGCGC